MSARPPEREPAGDRDPAALGAIDERALRLERVARRQCAALVADDMPTMRLLLAQSLREAGFDNVVQAADGAAALAQLDRHGCELILADWNMPGVDGLELLARVRAHPRHGDVVFIMVTAENADDRVLQAIGHGLDDYLTKPVSPEKLSRRLELILARRRAAARAARLEAMGLPERAMDEYLMAARNNPQARWPQFGLGELLLRHGRLDEAKQCYQRLLRQSPQAAAAMVGLGRVALQGGDAASAQSLFQWAREANPAYGGAVDALTELHLAQGRPEQAAEVLAQAADMPGGLGAQRLANLASLFHDLGQARQADQALQRALAQDPALADGPEGLLAARCDLALGRPAKAVQALRRLARLADEPRLKVEAMLMLAETHLSQDRPEQAEEVFERMAQADAWPGGQRPFALHRLHAVAAAAHLRQGRPQAAAELVAVSRLMAPDDTENLAWLDNLASQLAARPADAPAPPAALASAEEYGRRGLELAAQGLHDQALAQYRLGLAVEPEAGRLHFNVAKLRLRAGQNEAAAESLALARRHGLAQGDWELLERLAELLLAIGEAMAARKLLLDILELAPGRPTALALLDQI